ncbi:MAG: AtpZ/AtpI family protein [Planctomycetota bacterium]|nr:AtpZ/AtpI family protein [Planctomycetota bacterium]
MSDSPPPDVPPPDFSPPDPGPWSGGHDHTPGEDARHDVAFIPPTPEPPPIPSVLLHPVRAPAETGASRRTSLSEMGKAWGVAMEFMFTIAGGLLIGVAADLYFKSTPTGALIGLGLGFAYALWRILRRTLLEERARERARGGERAGSPGPGQRPGDGPRGARKP